MTSFLSATLFATVVCHVLSRDTLLLAMPHRGSSLRNRGGVLGIACSGIVGRFGLLAVVVSKESITSL